MVYDFADMYCVAIHVSRGLLGWERFPLPEPLEEDCKGPDSEHGHSEGCLFMWVVLAGEGLSIEPSI